MGFLELSTGATLIGSARASHRGGFSSEAQALGRAGLVAVVPGLTAYGIYPDQGSNLCPLHCQADS